MKRFRGSPEGLVMIWPKCRSTCKAARKGLDPVALANLLSSGIEGAKTPFNTVLLRRPLEPG